MKYTRFAIYYLPPKGALAEFGASWLGWDIVGGGDVDQLQVADLDQVTKRSRKYGFHATLKPPFRLSKDASFSDLAAAVKTLSSKMRSARSDGLELVCLGRFLALVPTGATSGISDVAAACVTQLDDYRAPLSDAELERRRKAKLSSEQETNLVRWGYPYVLKSFRFHMTLTDRVPKNDVAHWVKVAGEFVPPLSEPFDLNEIALVGERPDGMFELIERYPLMGGY